MIRRRLDIHDCQLPKCKSCGCDMIPFDLNDTSELCIDCCEGPAVKGGQGRTDEDVKDSYVVLAMLALYGGAALVGGIIGGFVVHFLWR